MILLSYVEQNIPLYSLENVDPSDLGPIQQRQLYAMLMLSILIVWDFSLA